MLKRIFLVLLALVFVALGVAAYLWNQATRLPAWYEVGAPELSEAEIDEILAAVPRRESVAPRPSAAEPRSPTPDRAPSGRRELRLDDRQMTALVLRGLDAHPKGRRARSATKAVRVEARGENLAIGAVTDLRTLERAAESDKERAAVRKLRKALPWAGERDVYLGLVGRPETRGGRLVFEDARVEIGDLSFDPAGLAARLGVGREQLEKGIAVPLGGLAVDGVRVEDGAVWLSVAE